LPTTASEASVSTGGLKRKIGGRKSLTIPNIESTNSPDSVKSPEPKRKLERTIGGVKASATQSASEELSRPSNGSLPGVNYAEAHDRSVHLISGVADQSNIPAEQLVDDEIAAAEARADEKRRALKEELQQDAKPKPKKRRF
jgi:hypothetical protein